MSWPKYDPPEKWKRCYEVEYGEYLTGQRESYNHCGTARKRENGLYYCPCGGDLNKVCGYVGRCGNINPPPGYKDFEQLTFETI